MRFWGFKCAKKNKIIKKFSLTYLVLPEMVRIEMLKKSENPANHKNITANSLKTGSLTQ